MVIILIIIAFFAGGALGFLACAICVVDKAVEKLADANIKRMMAEAMKKTKEET